LKPEDRMNCIARFKLGVLLPGAILCAACGTQVSDPQTSSESLRYRVEYVVEPHPADGDAQVTLHITQSRSLLRELKMRGAPRFSSFSADGELAVGDDVVRWNPPATGGSISWRVSIPNRRNGDGYDAWLGPEFGLFRAEDLIPRTASRTLTDAHSETWLTFELPGAWSAVTQYAEDDGRMRVDNPDRRFDQPTGWIVIGNLGVRREEIEGMHVAVAAPVDHSVRRMDTLALLRWTLPELSRILPALPPRLTIISAADPMWRGGLSAPQSLFLHAERPMISENATSTLLHEVMHMSLGFRARDGYDWIVEGFAEYYSLQLLHRSGTISDTRFSTALADLAEWSTRAETLCGPTSSGATTALAVGVLLALNEEILSASDDEFSLDDVARELWQSESEVDADTVADIVAGMTGNKPDALHISRLPGCRTMTAASRAF
jgi:hypothetical protein